MPARCGAKRIEREEQRDGLRGDTCTPGAGTHLFSTQILMDELDGSRAFANSRCHALHGAAARVTHGKYSRDTGLQMKRLSFDWPALGQAPQGKQVTPC